GGFFNGLLQPYPPPPLTETPAFKLGSTVPIKFNWRGASGGVGGGSPANPAGMVYPAASCAAAPPVDTDSVIVPSSSGSAGLHYDAPAKTWIFNWDTKGLPNATCYWIQVTTTNVAFPAPTSLSPIALK